MTHYTLTDIPRRIASRNVTAAHRDVSTAARRLARALKSYDGSTIPAARADFARQIERLQVARRIAGYA